jgi:hypothetical protein
MASCCGIVAQLANGMVSFSYVAVCKINFFKGCIRWEHALVFVTL